MNETLKEVGVFVDPLDENDIAAKLRLLMDGRSYLDRRKRLSEFRGERSWETVCGEWLDLIRPLV